MESNGTFLGCNSKSVDVSLHFSPPRAFLSPPLSSLFVLPLQLSRLEVTQRLVGFTGERQQIFSPLIWLAVLVGEVLAGPAFGIGNNLVAGRTHPLAGGKLLVRQDHALFATGERW